MSSTSDCGADTPTCDDCFFRCELLCALPGNTVCPTFRAAERPPLLYAVPDAGRKPVEAAA